MGSSVDFRFFITGMKDGLYGVKDLEDGVTEFLNERDLLQFSKFVRIAGVRNGRIDIDWFTGYIMKEWTVKTSISDFVKRFGLVFTENNVGHMRLHLCRLSLVNGGKIDNYNFYEFITDRQRCSVGEGGKQVFKLREVDFEGIKYENKIKEGVGFRYLIER